MKRKMHRYHAEVIEPPMGSIIDYTMPGNVMLAAGPTDHAVAGNVDLVHPCCASPEDIHPPHTMQSWSPV